MAHSGIKDVDYKFLKIVVPCGNDKEIAEYIFETIACLLSGIPEKFERIKLKITEDTRFDTGEKVYLVKGRYVFRDFKTNPIKVKHPVGFEEKTDV